MARKNTRAQPEKREKSVYTADSFQNVLARLGVGMPSMLEATEYPLTRLTQNYTMLNSLYRNHWIVRKIVDVIPEDMCKNWIKLKTQVAPEQLSNLEKVLRRTQTKARILEGLKWGRLYGGAAGIILIDGESNYMELPLDYRLIMPGSYKGLLILDRWSGISPEMELVSDITSPDFGLPKYYQMTLQDGRMLRVHHSRVLRFTGNALPLWESWAEQQWGASVVESVFDELKKRDNTSFNIANLVFLANLRIYKTGMTDLLSLGDTQLQQDFYNAMQTMNWMMNNSGMTIIGKEDEFDSKQYTFTGLNDVYESFMLDIAGACEIPVTRLFGRSPAGFNATGESDLTNYYDSIEEKQEAYLAPILDKLLPVIALSTWGMVPDDLGYEFNPLRKADPKENADLAKSMTESVITVYNANLISQQTALKELRQQSEMTGMWSNITDEDIAGAATSTDFGGELSGMGSFLSDFTGDADWDEAKHPRRKDGKFGNGGGNEKVGKEQNTVRHLESIDFRDKKMVQSTLEKYEAQIVCQDFESAIIITPDGKVQQVDGDGITVEPRKAGDLKGAIVTHNHPREETEYSFSTEDLRLFEDEELEQLRGVDHRYTYVLERNAGRETVIPDDKIDFSVDDIYQHYKTAKAAKEKGYFYERKPRK